MSPPEKCASPLAGSANAKQLEDAAAKLATATVTTDHGSSPRQFFKALVVGASGWGKTVFCESLIERQAGNLDVLNLKQRSPPVDSEAKAKLAISTFLSGRDILSFFSKRDKLVFVDDIEAIMRTERGYGALITELMTEQVQAHVLLTCGVKELKRLSKAFLKRVGCTYILVCPTPEECTTFLLATDNNNVAVVDRLSRLHNGNVRHVLNDLNSHKTQVQDEEVTAERARHLSTTTDSTLDLMHRLLIDTTGKSTGCRPSLNSYMEFANDAMLPALLYENYVIELRHNRYKLPEKTYRRIVRDAVDAAGCADTMEAYMYRNLDWDLHKNVAITRCGHIMMHLAGTRRRKTTKGGSQAFSYTPMLTNLAIRNAQGRKLNDIKSIFSARDGIIDDDAIFVLMDAIARDDILASAEGFGPRVQSTIRSFFPKIDAVSAPTRTEQILAGPK